MNHENPGMTVEKIGVHKGLDWIRHKMDRAFFVCTHLGGVKREWFVLHILRGHGYID
jgi:hypothetical protein